jgi:hypothetical protein
MSYLNIVQTTEKKNFLQKGRWYHKMIKMTMLFNVKFFLYLLIQTMNLNWLAQSTM